MRTDTLSRFYDMIESLPPLPRTVLELEETARDPHANAASFAAVLEKDPPVVANLLKLLNSAYYCLRREVRDVEQAVALLGTKGTREHVTAVAIYSLFEADLSPYGVDAEIHANAVAFRAAAIRRMAPELTLPTLLQDVARTLSGYIFDEAEKAEFLTTVHHKGAREAERSKFGTGIETIGAAMLEQWGFDPFFVNLLRSVEAPHRALPSLAEQAVLLRVAGDSVTPSGELDLECGNAVAEKLGQPGLATRLFESK